MYFSKNETFVLHKKKLYLYSFDMKVVGIETSGLIGNIERMARTLATAKRLFLPLNQFLTKSNGNRMI
jgi:hypothetical protein